MNSRPRIVTTRSNLLKIISFIAFFTLMTGPIWAQSSSQAKGEVVSASQTKINGFSAKAGRAEEQTAISDIGRQAIAHDAPRGKSKQSSFLSTEVEPLLLLLFGLFLFSVATGVKMKLLKR